MPPCIPALFVKLTFISSGYSNRFRYLSTNESDRTQYNGNNEQWNEQISNPSDTKQSVSNIQVIDSIGKL